MSCDGDTVSLTAAGRPAIEDVVLGLVPPAEGEPPQQGPVAEPGRRGLPRPVPGRGPRGELAPVHPRHRGLRPEPEHHRGRRLLDLLRQRPGDGEPSPSTGGSTSSPRRRGPWSPRAPAPRTAASTPWRATHRQHGPRRLPGLGLQVPGRPARGERAGLPHPAGELHGDPGVGAPPRRGLRAAAPLDATLRPQWIFGKTVHEGCDRAAYYEQGDFARTTTRPSAR